MARIIARLKVTKFSSEASLMDYQKHIRFSFAGMEKEIRLGVSSAFEDFLISAESHWMAQCRFAIQTKPRNSADRSPRNLVFPSLFARLRVNLRQDSGQKTGMNDTSAPWRDTYSSSGRRAADFPSIELLNRFFPLFSIQ